MAISYILEIPLSTFLFLMLFIIICYDDTAGELVSTGSGKGSTYVPVLNFEL